MRAILFSVIDVCRTFHVLASRLYKEVQETYLDQWNNAISKYGLALLDRLQQMVAGRETEHKSGKQSSFVCDEYIIILLPTRKMSCPKGFGRNQ